MLCKSPSSWSPVYPTPSCRNWSNICLKSFVHSCTVISSHCAEQYSNYHTIALHKTMKCVAFVLYFFSIEVPVSYLNKIIRKTQRAKEACGLFRVLSFESWFERSEKKYGPPWTFHCREGGNFACCPMSKLPFVLKKAWDAAYSAACKTGTGGGICFSVSQDVSLIFLLIDFLTFNQIGNVALQLSFFAIEISHDQLTAF